MALPTRARCARILAQFLGAVYEFSQLLEFWQLIATELQKLASFRDFSHYGCSIPCDGHQWVKNKVNAAITLETIGNVLVLP
jgi:hypothetical protein